MSADETLSNDAAAPSSTEITEDAAPTENPNLPEQTGHDGSAGTEASGAASSAQTTEQSVATIVEESPAPARRLRLNPPSIRNS
jgi:hypothetical protein